jgi:hypothetical protein
MVIYVLGFSGKKQNKKKSPGIAHIIVTIHDGPNVTYFGPKTLWTKATSAQRRFGLDASAQKYGHFGPNFLDVSAQ